MVALNPNATVLEEEGAFAVSDRAAALVRDGPHGYTSPVGMPELREAVAGHVHGRIGVGVDPG